MGNRGCAAQRSTHYFFRDQKRQTITGFYLYENNLSSCMSEWLAFQEKWPSGQVAINRPKGPPPHGLLRCCNSQCFCSQSPQLMSGACLEATVSARKRRR